MGDSRDAAVRLLKSASFVGGPAATSPASAQAQAKLHAAAYALAKIEDAIDGGGLECGHLGADQALCDLLRTTGYSHVVEAYGSRRARVRMG